MAYSILRTNKFHTNAEIASASGHNGRTFEVENADSSLSELNDLDDQSVPILEKWKARIGDKTVRKNAVRAVELFMGFSPEAKAHINPQEWKSYCQDFANNHFGEENILQVDLHMDEKTPHCQIILIPIDGNGKLNCRSYLGGKDKLIKLQDDFQAEVGSNFGLERGEKGSMKKHKPIKEYYHDLNVLSVELEHAQAGWDLVTKHKTPEIEKPPLTGRKEYQEETQKKVNQHSQDIKNSFNHVIKSTKKPILEGASKAMEVPQLKEERKALVAEKQRMAEQLKAERDKLRDLPLNDVMHALGFQEGRAEGREMIYETPKGHISINEDKGVFSVDWDKGSGSKGAINLVMEVNDCEFREAVSWLKSDFSQEQLERSAVVHAKELTTNITRNAEPLSIEDKIEKYAKKDDSKWDIGHQYLLNRGIDKKLIEQEYETGHLWTNQYGALCFQSVNKKCVHLRGTKGNYKQSIGDKDDPYLVFGTKTKSYDTPLILVESPIDVLSVSSIYKQNGGITFGGTTVRKDDYNIKFCGFDNDDAGQKGLKKVQELYHVDDWTPDKALGKDWNDVLLKYKASKDEEREAVLKWLKAPTFEFIAPQKEEVQVKEPEPPKEEQGWSMGF